MVSTKKIIYIYLHIAYRHIGVYMLNINGTYIIIYNMDIYIYKGVYVITSIHIYIYIHRQINIHSKYIIYNM